MDSSALFAAGATLAAFLSWRTGAATLRHEATSLISQIRSEWVDLRGDWTTVRALVLGPENYYSGAPSDTRDKLRQFAHEVSMCPDLSRAYSDFQQQAQNYSPSVARLVGYLEMCASLMLSGRLQVRDLYMVLGSDVARHGKSVRWALGLFEADWPYESSRGIWHQEHNRLLASAVDRSSNARQQAVLALIDGLWAQSAQVGDRDAHVLACVASHKQATGSGERNRRRVRRLSRGLLTSLRLQWCLLYAEYLPRWSIYQDGKARLDDLINYQHVRDGSAWRIRLIASFFAAYRYESIKKKLVKTAGAGQ